MSRGSYLSRLQNFGCLNFGSFYTTRTVRLDPNYKTFLPARLSLPRSTPQTAMSTTATITLPTVRPLELPKGPDINFGAQVDGVDLENLTGL